MKHLVRIAGAAALGISLSVAVSATSGATLPGHHRHHLPPPTSVSTYPSGNTAAYVTTTTVNQMSATVVVPSLSCWNNPTGTVSGEAIAAAVYSVVTSNTTSYFDGSEADLRAYCDGHTATYETEFVVGDPSAHERTFEAAGVSARPGDLLQLQVTATSHGSQVEQITNLSTRREATVRAPGFTGTGGITVGIGHIASNGEGAILVTGTVTLFNAEDLTTGATSIYVTGPASSLPVGFANVVVDGAPLSEVPGLYSFYWTTNGLATGTTLASVTPVLFGTDFAVWVR